MTARQLPSVTMTPPRQAASKFLETVPSVEELDLAIRLAESGAPPTRRAAEVLLHARGDSLTRLLRAAGRLRDEGIAEAGRPGVITYSRKVFIPLTHLCQDRCHYCIFVQTPGKLSKVGKSPFLSPDEILQIARAGAALGCKEALFTLGDRPENRWEVAREWLSEHGYASTIEYLRAMAMLVLEETGLLPHLNPGVMTWAELQRLKPVAPSMGMMLETTSARLWTEKGEAHYGSPDKDPTIRLRVLDDAGRSHVPFTTGVLLGIGERYSERVDAMIEIQKSNDRYGHIQEVIVQNFRAKPATAMMSDDDLETMEYVAAVAVTRLVLGPHVRIQAPPNLTDTNELSLLLRAGIDDWGGVSPLTPDHVNPERPWPQIDELARLTAAGGFTLRERLTAHPHFIRDHESWIDPHILGHLTALVEPGTGLAREEAMPVARPWALSEAPRTRAGSSSELTLTLARAESTPSQLSDREYEMLLGADGDALEVLTFIANNVRRQAVGDEISFVVNRNIDSSVIGRDQSDTVPTLSLEQLQVLTSEAWQAGVTEMCIQGRIPGEAGVTQLDIARAVKAVQPEMHLHAFRPIEIVDGARRLAQPLESYVTELQEAGLDTAPGTGARILNDRIRELLSVGPELSSRDWIDAISTFHRRGLRTSATIVYGHIESPAEIVAHLRSLIAIQDATGGFTELIPMPFLPSDAPTAIAGLAGGGPSLRVSRAMYAVARLMLVGRIDHIQASWSKLGIHGAKEVLQGGADDLGGTFTAGYRMPAAGAEAGLELTSSDMARIIGEIGRLPRQRTTTYESASKERALAAGRAAANFRSGPSAAPKHIPLVAR